jgi:hypothetical protein
MNRRFFEEDGDVAPAAVVPETPAAEPAAPSSSPNADRPGEIAEPDFAALAADFEDDEEDVIEPPASDTSEDTPTDEVPVVPETPPETPPEAPPVAAAPAVEKPPETPPAEATPPAEPAAAPPAQTAEPWTPEKIEATYAEYEKKILPQLEKQYALSEEQVEAINENPAAVIPQLAAQIHYKAQVAAYTGIMSQLPAIIDRVVGVRQTQVEATNNFFKAWPALKESKHSETVGRTLQAYRQANPSAPTDKMIKEAGTMAMLALGLDPTPPLVGTLPVTPPAPSRPAGTGGAGAARPADRGATDLWGDLADDIKSEGY